MRGFEGMRASSAWRLALGALALGAIGCGPSAERGREPASASSGDEGPSMGASSSSTSSSSIASNQQGALVPMPAPTAEPAPPPRGTVAGVGPGSDREHPVEVCGAMESYLYVAGRFQCPGGGNPLGGDPRAGAGARLGNVGPHAHGPERDPTQDAHIVDLYEVPCPTGAVQVHVCLYHCPAGRSPIDG